MLPSILILEISATYSYMYLLAVSQQLKKSKKDPLSQVLSSLHTNITFCRLPHHQGGQVSELLLVQYQLVR